MNTMLLRRASAEGIGTFFLVFIGTGAVMTDEISGGALGPLGIALAFGLVVMGMIYAIGHLSGAHLNPAVTIGFWSVRRFPRPMVPVYLMAQLLGAVVASGTLALIQHVSGFEASLGATEPSVPVVVAVLVEFLLSFVLMFVIMAVATDDRAPRGTAGLAIGIVVAFDAIMGGPLTGASMNPARSFGPALFTGIWTHHWIYWLAPIAAALAAAHVYEWIQDVETHDHSKEGPFGVEGPLERSS